MKKLPWRSAFYLIALLYLVVDLKFCNGPLKRKIAETRPSSAVTQEKAKLQGWVALVNQEPVTTEQLELAVARYLHQRGKSREEVSEKSLNRIKRASLRRLIDDTLVRQYANGVKFKASEDEISSFVESWESQFNSTAELRERTELQSLSSEQRREQLANIWSRKQWLEKRISPGIGVSDADVQAWFIANREHPSLTEPEKIRARQVFISTVEADGVEQENLINEAVSRLAEGEGFAEVAADLSQDERSMDRGGDLNWFSRKRVPDDFAEVVFSQELNQLGQPFKTDIGWHLVEVTDRQPPRKLSFEEVAPEIKAHLLNQQKIEKVNELLGKLRKVANIMIFTENLN